MSPSEEISQIFHNYQIADTLVGRLVADNVQNLSDPELEHALLPFVAGQKAVTIAKRLREIGVLQFLVEHEREATLSTATASARCESPSQDCSLFERLLAGGHHRIRLIDVNADGSIQLRPLWSTQRITR